jgi:hypothetical protein
MMSEITKHQKAVELELCKLHYEAVQAEFPDLLQFIEHALDEDIPLETVKGWIDGMGVGEELSHKFYSAARWYAENKR